MQMHDLNNTQLILLALLVSFVTSIATGIVTVTLLDQAPPVVTQTINRIIERTVEVVVPAKEVQTSITQTVVVKEEEFITKAAQKNSPNIVQVGSLKKKFRIGGFGRPPKEEFELQLRDMGFVLNSRFAVSQDYSFDEKEEPVIITVDGQVYRISIVARDTTNNIILFTIDERVKSAEGVMINADGPFPFIDTVFARTEDVQIGQTAIALGFRNDVLLSLGVVSQLETKKEDGGKGDSSKELVAIHTTINIDSQYVGGPLINTDGEIVGINMITVDGERRTIPIHTINNMIKRVESEQVSEEKP